MITALPIGCIALDVLGNFLKINAPLKVKMGFVGPIFLPLIQPVELVAESDFLSPSPIT